MADKEILLNATVDENINTNFIQFFNNNNIEIPLIQRDYVQGSDSQKNKRDKFVDTLLSALTNETERADLDFIYGTSVHGAFLPLDGQQRLTTLFLLHWYIIGRCMNIDADKTMALLKGTSWFANDKKFGYNTRISSSIFCERLKTISKISLLDVIEQIKEHSWFDDNDWMKDPSIKAMLSMLQTIENKINILNCDLMNMLDRLLHTSSINFDKLDMGKYNLNDSLYVKMNARGKQLTTFENWKARFIQLIEEEYVDRKFDGAQPERVDKNTYKQYFSQSIEHEWTDLFWNYAVDAYEIKIANKEKDVTVSPPLIDDLFLNFFRYICKMKSFEFIDKENDSNEVKELDLTKSDNLDFVFQVLDLFVLIRSNKKDGIKSFFNSIFYVHTTSDDKSQMERYAEDAKTKIKLFASKRADIFHSVLEDTASVDEQVLLYIIIKYCLENKCYSVSDQLKGYARKCRNLLENDNQRLMSDVKMHSNVRLSEIKEYIKKTTSFESLQLPSQEIMAVENSGYFHGYLGAFENVLSDDINMYKAYIAFRDAKEIDKVRVLIALGFKGANFGYCAHGDRIFFGSNERWDLLFRHAETAKKLQPVISGLVKNLNDGNKISDIINNRLHELESLKSYSFEYYMLKYDSFCNNAFVWAYNKKDNNDVHFEMKDNLCIIHSSHFFAKKSDYEVMALPRFSSSPVRGYHIEPYACAVAVELAQMKYPHMKKVYDSGENRDRGGLYLEEERIFLQITDHGWIFKIYSSDGKEIECGTLAIENDIDVIQSAAEYLKKKLNI